MSLETHGLESVSRDRGVRGGVVLACGVSWCVVVCATHHGGSGDDVSVALLRFLPPFAAGRLRSRGQIPCWPVDALASCRLLRPLLFVRLSFVAP